MPTSRLTLDHAELKHAVNVVFYVIDRENTLDREGLGILDALTQALRPEGLEHLIGVLAPVWPDHMQALLTPKAAGQLVFQLLAWLVTISGDDPLPDLIQSLVIQELKLLLKVLSLHLGCAIRNRDRVLEASNLQRQRIHLALTNDGDLVRDVVVLVEHLLRTSHLAKVLGVVAVLDVHDLAALVVGVGNGRGLVLDLRHPHALKRNAVAHQHLCCNAALLEPAHGLLSKARWSELWAVVNAAAGWGRAVNDA